MTFVKIYICFFIYSLVGWLWESFLCSSFELKKLVNRGFLLGPYCPIYGLGATISFMVLKNIYSSTAIFIIASVGSCLIEYFVAYILERVFGKKWWNYEKYPFQIHGRVCLYGFIIFGLANILIVKFTTPFLLFSLSVMKDSVLISLAIALTVISLIDLILTIATLKKLNPELKKIHAHIERSADAVFENMNNSPALSKGYLADRGRKIRRHAYRINIKLKHTEKNLKSYKDEYFNNF